MHVNKENIGNAFEVEYERQRLAKLRSFEKLLTLYSNGLPEIRDINKPEYWDLMYSSDEALTVDYGMQEDRIKTAVSYIPKGKMKVLDIGAGMGYAEELISKDINKELYANDFSNLSIKNLKKRFRGKFEKQSIYNLRYSNNFFDAILVLEVLEHIPPSKIFDVLASIKKLLKDDGLLIVSVPMNEGLEEMPDNLNGHLRMYTNDLIRAELELAGFEILDHKNLFAFGNLYTLKTMFARIFKTHKPNNIVVKAKKV